MSKKSSEIRWKNCGKEKFFIIFPAGRDEKFAISQKILHFVWYFTKNYDKLIDVRFFAWKRGSEKRKKREREI